VPRRRRGAEADKECLSAADPPCLHIITTPIIEIDGDQARARYYTIHTLHGPDARPIGVGEYDTIVRRCADGKCGWPISPKCSAGL